MGVQSLVFSFLMTSREEFFVVSADIVLDRQSWSTPLLHSFPVTRNQFLIPILIEIEQQQQDWNTFTKRVQLNSRRLKSCKLFSYYEEMNGMRTLLLLIYLPKKPLHSFIPISSWSCILLCIGFRTLCLDIYEYPHREVWGFGRKWEEKREVMPRILNGLLFVIHTQYQLKEKRSRWARDKRHDIPSSLQSMMRRKRKKEKRLPNQIRVLCLFRKDSVLFSLFCLCLLLLFLSVTQWSWEQERSWSRERDSPDHTHHHPGEVDDRNREDDEEVE